jgi:hypothetical protein
VAKTPGRLTFAPESSQPLGVVAYLRWENFYGDTIAQKNVAREINGAHAAFTKQRFDVVLPVEDRSHQRRRIIFQNFTVNGAEAHAIIVFRLADGAVFHLILIAKRDIQLEVYAVNAIGRFRRLILVFGNIEGSKSTTYPIPV